MSTAAARTSFAEAPLPQAPPVSPPVFGQQQGGVDGERKHLRVRRGAPPLPCVFCTPGGSGGGDSTARRAGGRRGGRFSARHSPAANLFGALPSSDSGWSPQASDMAWSPYPSTGDTASSSGPDATGHSAVAEAERLAQLHLGRGGNTAGLQATDAAEAAEQQLPNRLRTQLHVSGSQELPQQFEAAVNLEAAAAAARESAAAAGAATGDLAGAADAESHVPSGTPTEVPPTAPVPAPTEPEASPPPRRAATEAAAAPQPQSAAPGPTPPPSPNPRAAPEPAHAPVGQAAATSSEQGSGSGTAGAFVFAAAAGAAAANRQPSRSPTPTSCLHSPRNSRVPAGQQQQRQSSQQAEGFATAQQPQAAAASRQEQQQLQPEFVFATASPQPAQTQRPAAAQAFVFVAGAPQQQAGFVSISQAAAAAASRPRGSAGRHRRRLQPAAPARAPSTASAASPGLRAAAPSTMAASSAQATGSGGKAQLPKPPVFAVPPACHHKRPPAAEAAQDAAAAAAARSEQERNRGNEAFRRERYHEAAELYGKAIQVLWPYPSLHQRLALLLSNRAAALLAVSRPLAALADCRLGLQHDPSFARCALRMATIYTRLGEFPSAYGVLAKQREVAVRQQADRPGSAIELEQALAEVAAKEADVAAHEATLLTALRALGHEPPPASAPATVAPRAASSGAGGTRVGAGVAEGVTAALGQLEAAAAAVPHCEAVWAARSLALLQLGRLQEALAAVGVQVLQDEPAAIAAAGTSSLSASWRHWVRAQCAFHQGDYDGTVKHLEALAACQRATAEAAAAASTPFGGGAPSAATATPPPRNGSEALLAAVAALPAAADVEALAARLHDAQRLRKAGNDLIQAGQFADAAKKYTAALDACNHSAAFAALLYCNRAAAYQGQQQWVHAVADCCRAKALDPSYAKAHSRLAALLTELRRHEEAAAELEAVVALPGLTPNSKSSYQRRLAQARAAAQRRPSFGGFLAAGLRGGSDSCQPHHYRLLGLQQQCTQEEARRCFKKLALLLHPDKAASTCRFATRLGDADWPGVREVVGGPAEGVRRRFEASAGWLFKAAQEAAEVLLDPQRRRELDAELAEEEGTGFGGAHHSGAFGGRSHPFSAHAFGGSGSGGFDSGGGGFGNGGGRPSPHRYGSGRPGASGYSGAYHYGRNTRSSYNYYYY